MATAKIKFDNQKMAKINCDMFEIPIFIKAIFKEFGLVLLNNGLGDVCIIVGQHTSPFLLSWWFLLGYRSVLNPECSKCWRLHTCREATRNKPNQKYP